MKTQAITVLFICLPLIISGKEESENDESPNTLKHFLGLLTSLINENGGLEGLGPVLQQAAGTPYQGVAGVRPFGYGGYDPNYEQGGYGQVYGQSGQGSFGQSGHGSSNYGNYVQGLFGQGQGHFGYAPGQQGYDEGQYGYGEGGYSQGHYGYGQGQYGYGQGQYGYGQGQYGYGQGQSGYGQGQYGYGHGQNGYRPGYRPYPYRPQRPFYQPIQPGFGGALSSIAKHDDLRCVPRLLCEVASAGKVNRDSQSQSSIIPFANKDSLIALLTVLNFVDDSPVMVFGRAALLGYTSRGDTSTCFNAYPTCPKDPDQLVHYLNNHNGGFFRYFSGPQSQQRIQNKPSIDASPTRGGKVLTFPANLNGLSFFQDQFPDERPFVHKRPYSINSVSPYVPSTVSSFERPSSTNQLALRPNFFPEGLSTFDFEKPYKTSYVSFGDRDHRQIHFPTTNYIGGTKKMTFPQYRSNHKSNEDEEKDKKNIS